MELRGIRASQQIKEAQNNEPLKKRQTKKGQKERKRSSTMTSHVIEINKTSEKEVSDTRLSVQI